MSEMSEAIENVEDSGIRIGFCAAFLFTRRMDVSRFLFTFGFETPSMVDANERWNSDMEDSLSVFIEADSKEAALKWGRKAGARFLERLFADTTRNISIDDYAYWLEQPLDGESAAKNTSGLACITNGNEEEIERLVLNWLGEVPKT